MIDTHAHIYLEDFAEDIDVVVNRALKEGVTKILLPNIDENSINDMLHLEQRYPEICHSMMGLHPCYVKNDYENQLKVIEDWISKKSFIAVGEIGTDLYWDKSFWEEQKKAFNFQCEIALSYDLPVVIHCRDSMDETIKLISQFNGRGLRGVFHCFSGTLDQARQISDMGFYMGLGGVTTFKNGGMDKIVPKLDRDKIVLETDSPYLTPAPFRGKRNEPSYVKLVAEKIAKYLNMSVSEVSGLTTNNANALFFPKRIQG